MKRLLLISAGVLAAGGVAAAPAVAGLAGNPSFSHQIPVRVPSQARTVQPVDDHGRDLVPSSAASPTHGRGTARHPEPGDDRGGATRHIEPGDDRGTSGRESEPGDDHGTSGRESEPGDDHGGRDGGGDGDSGRGGSDG